MHDVQTQLNHKTAQLAAIREISQAIAMAQDLDDTLDLITRRTTEVMHVDSCSIYLYNDFEDELTLVASTGLSKEAIGQMALPHGAGLTGWSAENRAAVAVSNAFEDERFYRLIGSGESRFPSLMAMPLVSKNKVIGAANVQTERHHTFTEDEIELFGFITELAAMAIEKAQLVHRATVQEMHHRVKNNLQTVAMLLRLQVSHPKLSAKDVLNETINRVLSIATVHEILSESGLDKISLLDLVSRLAHIISINMTNPEANISIHVKGDKTKLRTQMATNLALVTNELIQNALEHGIGNRETGVINISLHQIDNSLSIIITDDGTGLPQGFDINNDLGLGLEIVRATITEDMSGIFEMTPNPTGTGTHILVQIPL